MPATITPYINFGGSAREAMTLYHDIFGGNLEMQTFEQAGHVPDGVEGDKIMHSSLSGAEGLALMASDAMPFDAGDTVCIALTGDDYPAMEARWNRLIEDGEVLEPLATAPWGDSFGMCRDRFGLRWLINVAAARG
ncbi:VOC family protein [Tomitella gaofuii]|uniref:VOC family protein n=1 Tax=Tomitella gaofuii TaxID=2760083 RepID=UPI0015FAC9CD|nr:VOC family protein [Tomitella gaofuii]